MIQIIEKKSSISQFKFKNSENVKFKDFMLSITSRYQKFRKIVNESSQSQCNFNFERILYISILETKIQKFLNQKNRQLIQNVFQKMITVLFDIQQIQNDAEKIYSTVHIDSFLKLFLGNILNIKKNSFQITEIIEKYNNLDYFLILIIRKIIYDSQGILQSIFKNIEQVTTQITYKSQFVKIVANFFDQTILIYKLNDSKFRIPTYQKDSITIGYIQNNYYKFYEPDEKTKQKVLIRLISQKKINIKDLENDDSEKEELKYQSITVQKKQKKFIKIISKQQIKNCEICKLRIKSNNFIIYNYKYYCHNCIISPQTQLEEIPHYQIQRYVKEKQVRKIQLSVNCPDCGFYFSVKNFDVLNKLKILRCTKCLQILCIKHQKNCQKCFCFCSNCKNQTYYDFRLKLKICLKCKRKYCENCDSKMKKCDCRCLYCYQIKGSLLCKCEVQKRCHDCFNNRKNLMNCECGGQLCRPCAFASIKSKGTNFNFKCSKLR